MNPQLEIKIKQLPDSPGCYLMKSQGEIIYVGKAKNLKNRVRQNNLIKLHKPFYNILLKDDKQYPYIRIDAREDFPRVELVRHMGRDGAKYFGPFTGATAVRDILDVLRSEFPLRTCVNMPKNGPGKRACVHAQIGQCMAPCTGAVTRAEYHARRRYPCAATITTCWRARRTA